MGIPKRFRAAYLGLAVLLIVRTADGAEIQVVSKSVARKEGHLVVSVALSKVFSPEVSEAIESGMTTTVIHALEVLSPKGKRIARKEVRFEIRHDIWEHRYLAIRCDAPIDSLWTDRFEEAERFCMHLAEVKVTPLNRLKSGTTYVLRLRTTVDPISAEQWERTKVWMRGSDQIIEIERDPEKVREFGGVRINLDALIDWFIQRTKPRDRAPWIELRRFALEDLR